MKDRTGDRAAMATSGLKMKKRYLKEISMLHKFGFLKMCLSFEFLKIKSYPKGVRNLLLTSPMVNNFALEGILLKHK